MDLSISNVVNISVSQAGKGIGRYNTSNLALFTRETAESSFGTDGYKIYLGPTEVGKDFGTSSVAFKMANSIFSQQPNILANRGYLVIIQFDDTSGNETIGDAIQRTQNLIPYFGILSTELVSQTDGLAAAAIVQPLNKMIGLVSRTAADVDTGGYFDLVRQGGFTKSRCLYHPSTEDIDALVMLSAYFGRAFSTNFQGSNTTHTMHLKDLVGVFAGSIDENTLSKCLASGADTYGSFQGVPKTFTSGANGFFDDIYNLSWFIGDMEVAGFNLLAQVSTKLPQTEEGMDSLKSVYRRVCEQGIVNQFLAPGEWTNPNTFGNQEEFFENIRQRGYYIYSEPVAIQNPQDREDRVAPLVQIAIKYAGAIHSSMVVVNINK